MRAGFVRPVLNAAFPIMFSSEKPPSGGLLRTSIDHRSSEGHPPVRRDRSCVSLILYGQVARTALPARPAFQRRFQLPDRRIAGRAISDWFGLRDGDQNF
jgi:hypothetical protein